MKLCWLGIHKNTQWRTPRNGTQSRSCIHCGRYERRVVITHSDFEGWEVKELTGPEEMLMSDGILEERTRPPTTGHPVVNGRPLPSELNPQGRAGR